MGLDTDSSLTRIHTGYSKVTANAKILGCSTLLRGNKIAKSDPACKAYSNTEWLRICASKCLSLPLFNEYEYLNLDIDQPNVTYLLHWVEENIIGLGSYLFNKGNTDRYHFPGTLLSFLNERKAYYEEEFYKGTGKQGMNFPIVTDPQLRQLDEFRVYVRELESNYVQWLTDSRVVLDLFTSFSKPLDSLVLETSEVDEVKDNEELHVVLYRTASMIRSQKILNDLSNFFWWYTQFAWLKMYPQSPMREWTNTYNPVFDPTKNNTENKND
jgi:hypothetical protein